MVWYMVKKRLVKVCILLAVVWLLSFSDRSFAGELIEVEGAFWSVEWTFNFVVSILSWIWVLFAKIAWELLTNKWVYGGVIWLDTVLWQYWNVMKNIANFGLWFYFVYLIWKWLINKDDILQKIKDNLLWILLAGVWVQASWFLTAAVVDFSTITLVAAGSFPSYVISQNSELKIHIVDSVTTTIMGYKKNANDQTIIDKAKNLELFPKNSWANKFITESVVPLENGKNIKQLLDDITPSADNVSWPLYYMWYAILSTSKVPAVNTTDETWIKQAIINLIIQWWTTAVYSIEMLVFCVLAFMRIVYLWMFIVLSPIAILVACIKQINKNHWNDSWILWSLLDQISLKSFFINVFKPTVIVLGFSVAMLFSVMMSNVINKSWGTEIDRDIWWVKFSTKKSSWDDYITSIETKMGKFTLSHVWKWILDLFLSVITVVLVYMVIDLSIKMWKWKDFVSKKITKLQENIWKTIKQTPFIPVPNLSGEWVSTISAWWFASLPETYVKSQTSAIDKKVSDQVGEVLTMWWAGDNKKSLTPGQETELKNKGMDGNYKGLGILREKQKYISTITTSNWRNLRLWPSWDSTWISVFTERLKNTEENTISDTELNWAVWKQMVKWWKANKDDSKYKGKERQLLEDMFKTVPGAVEAYAKLFKLEGTITDWATLSGKDISKKEDLWIK